MPGLPFLSLSVQNNPFWKLHLEKLNHPFNSSIRTFFFFFVMRFGTQGLTLEPHHQPFLASVIFWTGSSFCPVPQTLILSVSSPQPGSQAAPPSPAYLLSWGLANFFHPERLEPQSSRFILWSSWTDRCAPQQLAKDHICIPCTYFHYCICHTVGFLFTSESSRLALKLLEEKSVSSLLFIPKTPKQ
jgi:hypothetical protein